MAFYLIVKPDPQFKRERMQGNTDQSYSAAKAMRIMAMLWYVLVAKV
jgi:hypothetical protein